MMHTGGVPCAPLLPTISPHREPRELANRTGHRRCIYGVGYSNHDHQLWLTRRCELQDFTHEPTLALRAGAHRIPLGEEAAPGMQGPQLVWQNLVGLN